MPDGYISQVKLPNNTTYELKVKSNNITPAIHKTWAGNSYYATAANQATSTWMFMSIKPESWYKSCTVRFKIRSFCPGHTNCDSTTYCTITYHANSYVVSCWNDRYDHAHYYIATRLLTSTGFNAGLGHALGISILYSNNYTNSSWPRTFELDYYDCDACEVTILENPVLWSNWTNGTDTNYGGWNNANAVDRGLQESGDANNYDLLQMSSSYLTNGSTLRFPPYTIFGLDKNGNAQAFSLYQANYNSSTASINQNRVYNTAGIDWTRGIFYYSGGSNYATSVQLPISVRSAASAFDIRYSDNAVASTGAANTLGLISKKPIYIRGTIDDDGLFHLAPLDITYNNLIYKRVWTQDIPTENSDYVYWFLGYPYYNSTYANSLYQADLYENNPLFWYHNGSFQEYIPHAINSDTVNGLTVQTAVPTNALFTDRYHKTGSWSGLTYTATAVNSADELKFTIPNKIQTNWELNATSGNSPSLLFTRDGSLTDWKILVTGGKLSFQSATDASTWTERASFADNSGNFTVTGTMTATKFNNLTLTAATTGFTITGGSTTSKTLTVSESITLQAGTASKLAWYSAANTISGARNAYLIDESGTSVANKRNELVLGNATDKASNGSAFGRLALYSPGTTGTYLVSAESSNGWFTATLPAKTGTIAYTSDITSALASYLPLSGGTLTGDTYFNSSTGSRKFYITRLGGTGESAGMWQDDAYFHVDVTNDETTANIQFKLSAIDTEGSDGSRAQTSYVTFGGSGGKSTVTADYFTGLASKATGDADGNAIKTTYAKLASPTFTGTPKSVTPSTNSDGTMIATKAYVDGILAANDALVYKGVKAGAQAATNGGTLLPAGVQGDTYKVSTAGYINGVYCEVGDMIICVTDVEASTTSNYTTTIASWNIIQTSDGTVSTSETSVTENTIPRYSGNTGKFIKKTGVKIDDNNNITLARNVNISTTGYGLYLTDGASKQYAGIYDNGTNLWIGATSSTGQHHKGGTYISTGHNGTSGNLSAYICIPANGNATTTYTTYPIVYKDATGSATQPIYIDVNGKTVACTTYADATVAKAGSANLTTTTNALAYYTNTTGTFGNASKITVYNDIDITVQNATKKRNGIRLSGTCYGNTASDLTSNTAGVMRYEDGGVRIEFSADSSDNAALLYTNHDSANTGGGASFHFVGQNGSNNQGGNLAVTAPDLVARRRMAVGYNFTDANYVLKVGGATYVGGAFTQVGNFEVRGNTIRFRNANNDNNQAGTNPYVTALLIGDSSHVALNEYKDDYLAIKAKGLILNARSTAIAVYNPESTYAVGAIVWYSKEYYICKTAIETAEAWTAAHWTALSAADNVLIEGTLRPLKNSAYNLGTSTYKWSAVYATTYYGALETKTTGTSAARPVWFSYYASSAVQDGVLEKDTDFTYNPSTNVLVVGKLTITGGTANSTIASSGTLDIANATKALTVSTTTAALTISTGNGALEAKSTGTGTVKLTSNSGAMTLSTTSGNMSLSSGGTVSISSGSNKSLAISAGSTASISATTTMSISGTQGTTINSGNGYATVFKINNTEYGRFNTNGMFQLNDTGTQNTHKLYVNGDSAFNGKIAFGTQSSNAITNKAYMVWNNTDLSIDFIFV